MSDSRVRIIEPRTIKSQVKSGFRLAGNVLLTIATAGLLFGGVAAIFIPSLVLPESFLARSQFFGWTFLVVATTILIVKTDRWVTILPGILGYGAFGGLLAIISGHLSNNPSARISRTDATLVTVFLAISSAVSSTFPKRSLNVVDRITLPVYAFTVAFSISPNRSVMFTAMSVGLASLLLAWAYYRITSRHVGDG